MEEATTATSLTSGLSLRLIPWYTSTKTYILEITVTAARSSVGPLGSKSRVCPEERQQAVEDGCAEVERDCEPGPAAETGVFVKLEEVKQDQHQRAIDDGVSDLQGAVEDRIRQRIGDGRQAGEKRSPVGQRP